MLRGTVVPNRHRVLFPPEANLKVLAALDVVVQELEVRVAFVFTEAFDLSGEPPVDIQGSPACQWMRANDGVEACVRSAAVELDEPVFQSGLGDAPVVNVCVGVVCLEARDDLLVRVGERVVSRVSRGPEGVAADFGGFGDFEDGVGGGFGFVGDIGVPAFASHKFGVGVKGKGLELFFFGSSKADRVHVQRTELATESLLLFVRDVLVTEKDNSALGNQQSEVFDLFIGELGKLDTRSGGELGADGLGHIATSETREGALVFVGKGARKLVVRGVEDAVVSSLERNGVGKWY